MFFAKCLRAPCSERFAEEHFGKGKKKIVDLLSQSRVGKFCAP
jgi:hypothetical protein